MPQGPGWSFRVVDNVIVGEFPADAQLTGEESDEMVEQFTEFAARPETTAYVTILRSADAYSAVEQAQLEHTAEVGADHGVTRWGIVATHGETLTVASAEAVGGVEEVATFEDAATAIDWATE
jgi:hypothetical protein